MNKRPKNSGFTLLELLTVIVVLIAIGTIIGAILFSSLRGTNKTNTITNVRQNGNYAISLMSKAIRDGARLDSPYPCVTPVATSSVSLITATGSKTVFSCDLTSSPHAILQKNGTDEPASILDTNIVFLESCSLTCNQSSSSNPPTIGINFTLTQNGTPFYEKQATISFQTSITMRNPSK